MVREEEEGRNVTHLPRVTTSGIQCIRKGPITGGGAEEEEGWRRGEKDEEEKRRRK